MRRLLTAFVATAIAIAGEAHAQARECRYVAEPGTTTSGAGNVVTIQGPFEVICTDGSRVRASSGVVDQTSRIVTLEGNVDFADPMRTLTSSHAVYEINVGRLHATGNVLFTDRQEGTTLRGPELEYFRVMEGRPEALVNAPGRPHLSLQRRQQEGAQPTDSAAPPLEVDADHMTIVGQDNLTATGNVVIEDPDMRATADEAEHRGEAETLELRGNSAIHSDEYSLQARTIFASIPGGSLREVQARGQSELLGKDLNVTAPQLDLLFENDLLQRSVAQSDSALAPGVQPVATSPTFRLSADSIDASLPGQRLEMVVAIGNARGESIDTTRVDSTTAVPPDSLVPRYPQGGIAAPPLVEATPLVEAPPVIEAAPLDSAAARDSLPAGVAAADSLAAGAAAADSLTTPTAAELVENDWIVGDTITGYFTSVEAVPDSLAEADEEALLAQQPPAAQDTTVVLERLVALGAAQSLYHMAPEENAAADDRRGINFLSAARIELIFVGGQVDVARVSGLRRGMYLEPKAPGEAPAAAGPAQGVVEEGGNGGGTTPSTVPDDTADREPEGQPAPVEPSGENE